MKNFENRRAIAVTILVFVALVLMFAGDSKAQPEVRYCKKVSTGEIVVVDSYSRCPDGFWEMR